MAARPAPLFADDSTAAALFCMKPAEFRRLVNFGYLPRPCNLGGHERWDVEELARIARGDKSRPDGGLET
jgi:hypothetical protein